MTGATADGEHIDLVELLHRSDLPAVDRRRVYDACVSSSDLAPGSARILAPL